MKTSRIYYRSTPPGKRPRQRLLRLLLALLCVAHIAAAQDLIVNGTMNNTGKIRVANQTVITQPSVGGEIELKGGNQILPAKNYQQVRLSGTGTKTTAGGDLTISGNLFIAAPVTLKIAQGNIITLGDTLFESGRLSGAIQKSVNLSGATTASDFGNIGARISWVSSAPGTTTVLRASDSLQTGNGNQSIRRFYAIQSVDASAVGSISLKYSHSELNGHTGGLLRLWRSGDNGINWRYVGGSVDTANVTLNASNVILSGRWTAADSLHPLGPFSAPGVPTTLVMAQGNHSTAPILTTVRPLVVLITDAYDTPQRNVPVQFSITGTPATAGGHSLSAGTVLTDSVGKASCILRLGNKVGTYTVEAASAGLMGSPILFAEYATSGQAANLQLAAGNDQSKPILQSLDSPLSVTALDAGGNPVPDAAVHFAISSAPPNASGQGLSVKDGTTDSSGTASTILRLGTKAGAYEVAASLANGTAYFFSARAIAGAPHTLQLALGNRQTKPILTPLDTALTVIVTDTGGNAINATPVRFAISSVPKSAGGQTLSVQSTVTDSLGRASTYFTPGDKTGEYIITATKTGLRDSAVFFTSTATSGKPAQLLMALGNNQSKQILKTLDTAFTITLLDIGGNAVSNASVQFALASVPAGAGGQELSLSSAATDTLGHAATVLTLGDKVGNYTITASSSTLPELALSFTARALTGNAAAMLALAGNNQSATINSTLSTPFGVAVTDAGGNPVANERVACSILGTPPGAAGYSLSATSIITNSAGQAASRMTLGNKVGTYTVAISAPSLGGGTLVFSAHALPGSPASLALSGGDGQTGTVAEQLKLPMAVSIADIGGNVVPGVAVKFSMTSIPTGAIGQMVGTESATTDTAGAAHTTVTLGTKSGVYTVTATVAGLPMLTMNTLARPGAPAALASLRGNSQSKTINSVLDTAFVTAVADMYGNAVPQAEIRFAITGMPANATGAMLSDTLVRSDSSGSARSVLTLGSKVGDYTIASALQQTLQAKRKNRSGNEHNGPAPVYFTAHADHGAPATLFQRSGGAQLRPAGTQLPTPFLLTVYDAGYNVVPYVAVRFAISSAPPIATGQMLSDTLTMTDSAGTARSVLTLGSAEGLYTVTAAAAGAPPLAFSADAYYIIGDPNNDIDVNIADLTLLNDYLSHRIQPSSIDSIKADITHDGRIDTADVGALRHMLLTRTIFSDSSIPAMIPMLSQAPQKNTSVSGQLEATPLGLRFNLENGVPVRGIELHLLLSKPYTASSSQVLFSRGQAMSVFLSSQGNELTAVLYNAANSEIPAGSGSIFRLPLILDAAQHIDTSSLVLSYGDNKAMKPGLEKTVASDTKYPERFALVQNYPNPFNSATTIRFDVPDVQRSSAKVLLQIYNTVGQLVRTLADGPYEAGHYSVVWDGRDGQGSLTASGVYFYRLIANDYLSVKKMVYLR